MLAGNSQKSRKGWLVVAIGKTEGRGSQERQYCGDLLRNLLGKQCYLQCPKRSINQKSLREARTDRGEKLVPDWCHPREKRAPQFSRREPLDL